MVIISTFLDGPIFRAGWAEREGFICCIEIDTPAGTTLGGTGVLVGPDLVLTNYHVIDTLLGDKPAVRPGNVRLRFDYKQTTDGLHPERTVGLAADWYVAGSRPSDHDFRDDELPTEDELDYAVIRLAERLGDQRGWLALAGEERPAELVRDGFLAILQHPGLGMMQAAFATNGVIAVNANQTRVRHRVGTRKGSSGAPCFDREWNLVALHHGGDERYPEFHHDAYNQAIPIWRIVGHLRAGNHFPLAGPAAAPTERPRLDSDKFQPSLIILCAAADRERARQLMDDAGIPPSFVARIGNRPPATIADNAIAVFLGGAAAMKDAALLATVDELRGLNLQVIPIVTDLRRFFVDTPRSLHAYNGVAWQEAAAVPEPLRTRVRQLLGLAVDPSLRSVFISYAHRDHKDAVVALGQTLGDRPEPYRVFLDTRDIAPGHDVQRRIDEELQGHSAVLHIETESAHASEWIRQELKWAYTRGLPLVVWQCGRVPRRNPLIGALPVHHTADPARLPLDHEAIAAALDREITLAWSQKIQLGRMIEAVAKLHSKAGEEVAIESVDGKPHLVRMILHGKLIDLDTRSCIWIATTHHRPSDRLVQDLVHTYDELSRTDGSKYHKSAAVLLYDAPEPPLDTDDVELFNTIRGNRPLFWIERQALPARIPELMTRIR